MAELSLSDLPPVGYAGVRGLRCRCGWELTAIMPEENDFLLFYLIHHLEDEHGFVFPEILVTNY